jgi:hypothetical protein
LSSVEVHGSNLRFDSPALLSFSFPSVYLFLIIVSLQPGRNVKVGMCVWQGFIASAPGHPFLADAIESVVNHVRNRFTTVDMATKFCPNPDITVLLYCEVLLLTGPCRLEHRSTEFWSTARASLSLAKLCRRVISRPFQAAQSYYSKREMGMP